MIKKALTFTVNESIDAISYLKSNIYNTFTNINTLASSRAFYVYKGSN